MTTDHDGHTVAAGPATVHTGRPTLDLDAIRARWHALQTEVVVDTSDRWDLLLTVQKAGRTALESARDVPDLLAEVERLRARPGDPHAVIFDVLDDLMRPHEADPDSGYWLCDVSAENLADRIAAALTAAGWPPARPDDTQPVPLPGRLIDARSRLGDIAAQGYRYADVAAFVECVDALVAAGWPNTAAAEVERLTGDRPDDDGPDESLAMAIADVDQLTAQVDRLTGQLAQVTRERDDRGRVLTDVIAQRDTAYRARDEARRELDLTEQERANARQAIEDLRTTIAAYRDAVQPQAHETAGDAVLRVTHERDAERERADQLARAHDHLRNEAWQASGRLAAFPVCYNACHKAAHANANALRVALDGTTPAPNTTQPPALEWAMHSVWLHGKWAWLTRNMTTEAREAASDAVDRVGEWLSRSDGEDRQPIERWWRDGPAPNATQPLYVDADGKPTGFPRVEVTADVHIVPASPASSPTADQPAPGEGQDATETGAETQAWYPVACEHGYDHCPSCDAGTKPAPVHTGPAPTPPPDLGDDPDGDNTTETGADRG